MPFPDNTDFCCLALNGPRLDVPGLHILLPGLTLSNSQDSVDLDETWAKWLGSLQADSFRKSSLFITAQKQHLFAGGDEAIRLKLEDRVRLLHKALVLEGCGYNSSVLMIGGNVSGGHLHVGPVSSGLTPSYRPFRVPRLISMPALKQATTILSSLEHVYEHVREPLYRRIRKGFNLWIRGTEEGEDLSERLHLFLRATEAIIRPTIAKKRRKGSKKPPWRAVTNTFKDRGQTFVGRSKRNSRLLQQLYGIRSSIAHVHDILPKVHKVKGMSSEEAFRFRALQCEILASAIYSRIFTNNALREQLRTERGVEGFWRRSEARRVDLWGESTDINTAALREFDGESSVA